MDRHLLKLNESKSKTVCNTLQNAKNVFKKEGCFPLDCAEIGVKYHIEKIVAPVPVKRRLLDLGFVECAVEVAKKSLSGGAFLLKIRGYVLALKCEEVHAVWVRR